VSNSPGEHERFFTKNSVHQFQCWIYDLHAEYLNFWNFYLEKLLQLASACIFLFSHFIFFCSYNFLFHSLSYSIVNRLNCQENANVKVFCTNCMSMHFPLNMRRYSKAIKGFQFQICNARSNYLMQTTTKRSSVSLFVMALKRKSIIVDSWKGNYRSRIWMMWSG